MIYSKSALLALLVTLLGFSPFGGDAASIEKRNELIERLGGSKKVPAKKEAPAPTAAAVPEEAPAKELSPEAAEEKRQIEDHRKTLRKFREQMNQGGKADQVRERLSIQEQNQLRTAEILKEGRPSGAPVSEEMQAKRESMKKRASLWENPTFKAQAFLEKAGLGGKALTDDEAARLRDRRGEGWDGGRDGLTKSVLENHSHAIAIRRAMIHRLCSVYWYGARGQQQVVVVCSQADLEAVSFRGEPLVVRHFSGIWIGSEQDDHSTTTPNPKFFRLLPI